MFARLLHWYHHKPSSKFSSKTPCLALHSSGNGLETNTQNGPHKIVSCNPGVCYIAVIGHPSQFPASSAHLSGVYKHPPGFDLLRTWTDQWYSSTFQHGTETPCTTSCIWHHASSLKCVLHGKVRWYVVYTSWLIIVEVLQSSPA